MESLIFLKRIAEIHAQNNRDIEPNYLIGLINGLIKIEKEK